MTKSIQKQIDKDQLDTLSVSLAKKLARADEVHHPMLLLLDMAGTKEDTLNVLKGEIDRLTQQIIDATGLKEVNDEQG